jgi:hypothetical protein
MIWSATAVNRDVGCMRLERVVLCKLWQNASMEDAMSAGIDLLAEVVTTGSNYLGLIPEPTRRRKQDARFCQRFFRYAH